LVALVAACHGHDHDSSERDTKGRSGAVVGNDKPTVDAARPPPSLRVRRTPLLFDVNGDGHDDAVVVADTKGGPYVIAAVDGTNGATLWQSDPVEHWTNPLFVVGGIALQPDDGGSLVAYDFKSTKPAWTASLGEKVKQLCEGPDPTQVRVLLADQRSLFVTLKTGEQAPATKVDACKAISSNKRDYTSDNTPTSTTKVGDRISCSKHTIVTSSGTTTVPNPCRTRLPIDPDSIDGMSVYQAIVVDGGFLLSGVHHPGTAYPVIGLLKGRAMAWKSDIPDGNPLLADSGAGSVMVVGNRAVAAYESARKPYVTAFAVDTGHRDWVVPFPYDRAPVLSASKDTIFAFADVPDALVGFAPATGATLFSLGR
jgi:hypothetical protein